ncbi:MAG TPA: pilus assembly protein TadG-related protein [Caulifigura sp.]|nr:pilus assembly protein TadG-related protein [Caulifigura sp.]
MHRTDERRRHPNLRRGVFMVLAAICLITAMGFVSLCVDVGYLSLAKQRMQNACDAAALAAAMEITDAVQNADASVSDVMAYAASKARIKAKDVAALNGVYVDANRDVVFGQRTADSQGNFAVNWNVSPYNVVKVTSNRNNPDASKPDAKLKLFFAGVLGDKTASLSTNAAAYVESRDIVCVLDFSGSMNDDSTYAMLGTRDRAALEANMKDIYDILDGLHDFGDLEFEPEWLTQTASSGEMNGSVVFKDKKVDIATSHNIISLKLNSGTATTYNYADNKRTFNDFTSSSSINKVEATVQYQDWGGTASGSNSSSGYTASVTFTSGSSINVSTNSNMANIKFVYYPSGNSQITASGKSMSTSGQAGKYISQVQVKMGSTWVTVNNPNGSSPDITTKTLTFDDSVANVKTFFGLTGTYPLKGGNGESGTWDDFINHVRSDSQINSAGYRRKYGGKCLVNYLLTTRETFAETGDLWRTPHYPFHSLKQGAMLFADFLEDLSFGDEVGFVSYGETYRTEHSLNYDGYSINMSTNPINNQFGNFKELVRHKQAGHYDIYTNIGGGLKQGKLLLDQSARPGTQPTILLITDGLPNRSDAGFTFPGNWDWGMFDYDKNGTSDYSTNDQYARFALAKAKEAVDAGYTIHTLSVGTGADTNLMKAIAWMGKGVAINVPGDSSVAQMEAEVLEAFNRIAAFVPPAKLIKTD